jgi:glycosyltransferase involved in cell wall biosynthesis
MMDNVPEAGQAQIRRVNAILTAHDRRDLTLACLRSFFAQNVPRTELRAVVVDDGSSDGTADAVSEAFPAAEVITGTGDLFWARGMATAEAVAVQGAPDYLLWLNDDVSLYPGALQRLLGVAEIPRERPVLVAGAVCDPLTGVTTYGGMWRRDWHPLRYSLVEPLEVPVTVDTVHGNVLLVPRRTYLALGGIDGNFAHSYADNDYGLRLRRAGGENVLTAGHVGTCAPNNVIAASLDPTLPLSARWKFLHSRKGRPLGSQVRFLRRHGGPFWPIYLLPPYVRLLAGRSFATYGSVKVARSPVGSQP